MMNQFYKSFRECGSNRVMRLAGVKNSIFTFALMLFTSLTLTVMAQDLTVSGTVKGTDGSGLPGVTVQVKGTTKGTQTDLDGKYKLAGVPKSATLVFSSVGMSSQEIAVGNRSVVDVKMSDDAQILEQVVVVGYGTQKVKDATGSVASLGAKEFTQGVISSPEQLLQGKVAGVQMTPNSGDPGAGINLTIRGSASLRGSNGPLFVIDGIAVDNSDLSNNSTSSAGFGSVASRNPLNFMNPNDIENISILKDASAAAIYGARGANGVVLITTKKGKSGAGSFNFSVNGSMSSAASKYQLLSSTDFLAQATKGGLDVTSKLVNGGASTDWQDQIYRTAYTQNYNMSYGGGTDKTNYYFSLGYQDQQGIVKTTGQDKIQARINASHKLFDDKVVIGVNLTTAKINDTYAAIGGDVGYQGNLISTSIKSNPTFPIYNSTGGYYTTGSADFRNPVSLLNQIAISGPTNRTLMNVFASWAIVDGLTYKLNLGQDNSTSELNTSVAPNTPGFANSITNNQGMAIIGNKAKSASTIEHTLNYKKTMGKSELDVLAGFAYSKFQSHGSNVTAQLFITPAGFSLTNNIGFVDNSGTTKPYDASSFSNQFDLQSYFGRAAYSYAGKYYLTGTLRIDGSSKFGANNKYGYFPAVNGAWRISQEDFMQGSAFSDLKLRAGYGVTGNSEGFPINQSLATYIPNKNSGGISKENVENPNLKWESMTSYGVGLDFAFLKGRLSGTVDYFNKRTNNLLFPLAATQPDVATTQWSNLDAAVVNKGVEVSLNYDILSGKKLSWDAGINMTFLTNTIEKLNNTVFTGYVFGQGLSGAYVQPLKAGYPLYSFFTPQFLGFDEKGNNKLSADNVYAGSPFPTMTWGFNNNLSYGGWRASIFINGQSGGYIFNNTALALGGAPAIKQGNNTDSRWLDSQESFTNGLTPSTRFVEKSDFVRLSNLTISRSIPLESKSIKSLSVSLSGQNLLLLTSYKGLDPEVTNPAAAVNGIPSVGIDYISYPKARTFTVGISASF